MPNITAASYSAFARFQVGVTTYYLGTTTALRGGNWYTGPGVGSSGLRSFPVLDSAFADDGMVQARSITLDIADNAGTFRTLFQANALDGVSVTVDLVTTLSYDDGTSGEVATTQVLTVRGKRLTRGGVALQLVDLEDERLGALYPPNSVTTTDWPELSTDDSGRPLCEPVGTALKLPCTLIRSDSAGSAWWYAVCSGAPKLYSITSVNSAAKQITVSADLTGLVETGQVVYIAGSSAADGRYTVTATSYGASTVLTVAETLPSSTGGSVRAMPHALAVYRSGRLVPASEYAVHHLTSVPQIVNGDFAAGISGNWQPYYYSTGTGFTTTNPGLGSSVTLVSGAAQITSVNGANLAFIRYTVGGGGVKAAYYALTMTVSYGSDAEVTPGTLPPTVVFPAGKRTTQIIAAPSTGALPTMDIYVRNNTGTTTVDDVRIVPLDMVLLQFAKEQRDFNGALYTIEADVRGIESRNAADEISRLLTAAGCTPDASSFSAAQSVASAAGMLVDCDYGRDGQRRYRAILEDLLFIARGTLDRTSAGAYRLVQDTTASAGATWDESAGDRIEVTSIDYKPRPSSVAIKYRPGSKDPAQLQHTITRTVTGGAGAPDSPREVRYLRDHVAADRLLCYLALRAQYNGELAATIYRTQQSLGQRVAVVSPSIFDGTFDGMAWEVQRVPNGNAVTLREYNSAVYTYTPGESPRDAATSYQPDYSNTPPLAPSALKITAGSTAVANDGTVSARITVECVPPAVNWSEIWFAVIHNTTAEQIIGRGDNIGGGKYGTTIPGLRPGEVYQLKAYAKNAFALQGTFQATFDATAIGGGATATTFTAPGLAALPGTVSAISAVQDMGRIVTASWTAVSASNLWGYVLERSVNGGAYAEVWRGQGTSYRDTSVSIGLSYAYRVKARDTYGNVSAAYATSSAVTLTGNVVGGVSGNDIAGTTVATANRTTTTTISASFTDSGSIGEQDITIAHSLGKNPTCAPYSTSVFPVYVRSISSTQVVAGHFRVPTAINNFSGTSGNNSVAGDPHVHDITHGHTMATGLSSSQIVYVDIW